MSYRDDAKYIVVKGNLSDGFSFHGPFNSFDDAEEWTHSVTTVDQTWIATLEADELS